MHLACNAVQTVAPAVSCRKELLVALCVRHGQPGHGHMLSSAWHVQVQHLGLLSRLHIKRSQYREAATVYQLLGLRKSGSGDLAVSLAQRQDALQAAVLQVIHP